MLRIGPDVACVVVVAAAAAVTENKRWESLEQFAKEAARGFSGNLLMETCLFACSAKRFSGAGDLCTEILR